MEESQKQELSAEQLVEIANSLNAQVKQMDMMIKDLGSKVAQKEVENSQLKAIVQTMSGAQSAPAQEEE
tara:strand:- start:97 stop:303 length:207 start_codon:yes stop_codon:yes gene_type:complete